MSRKIKQKSGVYAYLYSRGVLETGTPEEILKARKDYWREYKCKWRSEKRKKEKEITISFNDDELKLLTREAKRHKLNRTAFIKQASFAYINKSFIVPDRLEVQRISQLLSMTYNSVQESLDENKVSFNLGRSILEAIRLLERDILPLLNNPETIEEYIKNHIKKGAENKLKLLRLINSI